MEEKWWIAILFAGILIALVFGSYFERVLLAPKKTYIHNPETDKWVDVTSDYNCAWSGPNSHPFYYTGTGKVTEEVYFLLPFGVDQRECIGASSNWVGESCPGICQQSCESYMADSPPVQGYLNSCNNFMNSLTNPLGIICGGQCYPYFNEIYPCVVVDEDWSLSSYTGLTSWEGDSLTGRCSCICSCSGSAAIEADATFGCADQNSPQ